MESFALLIAILQLHQTIAKEILVTSVVKLAQGMILECVYPGNGSLTQMEWFKFADTQKEIIAIFHPVYGMHITEAYQGRVHFLNSSKSSKDMSISFKKVSGADIGIHYCSIQTFPGGFWGKAIQVVKTDDFAVPRSPGSLMWSEPGQTANLTCKGPAVRAGGRPVLYVTWERIRPHQVDTLLHCELALGMSYGSPDHGHIQGPCSQRMSSSFLVLHNVTASDSGLYRCTFRSSTGLNMTCETRLVVSAAELGHSHVYFIAGGVASLSLLMILLAALTVYCNWKRKRKRKRKALFKDLQEFQTRPCNSYGRPDFPNQPQNQADEDIYINCLSFSKNQKTRR
ncbi:CD226 antigen [Tachyglossus aculeatus]|uniref:CD226 antigen n=1 Tax=Tachyglossus aculeatus TaxID=9261 RepID=UPI0018F2B55D|nr:CD226 antigen [Tachyglossus aculeatus]